MLMLLFREFGAYYETNMTEMKLKCYLKIISCGNAAISDLKCLVVT